MACNNCKKSIPCGCPIRLSSFCVKYDLDLRLPNIPVNPGNNLQDILINIDSKILEIENSSSSQNLSFDTLKNELSITGGNTINIPLPDNETVTTLVDNGTNFTYTSEDGTITTVDLTTGSGGLQSVVAGTNITINNSDPLNPIISSTGGGASLPVAAQNDFLYNNGTDWIKVTPVLDIQVGLTGTTLTLPSTPITTNPYYLDVIVNIPRVQGAGFDYTISGNIITFNFTLQTTDIITTKYITA